MLRELLLPRTDAGVLVQVVVAIVVYAAAAVLARHDRDLRMFVFGLAAITAAWFGLRTIH